MGDIEKEVAGAAKSEINGELGLEEEANQAEIRKGISEDEEEDDYFVNKSSDDEGWLAKARKKRILYQKVDHSKIHYLSIKKDFYIEAPDLKQMTPEEVALYRRELGGVKIRGKNCPRPLKSWGQCGIPAALLQVVTRLKFEKPTPIQAQAIPCVMSGRDVIGVAKTGSGKTLAFLLPLIRHVAAQPPLSHGEGPIGLIVAPTRELTIQIHNEAKRFCKAVNLTCTCAYGGSGVGEQIANLKRGAEIVICTPGRMIDLLAMNNGRIVNLKRVSMVVLDEADRMFDMGFEPQITRIIENIRPDRQTVMFSATFPMQVENLARKVLKQPVEITVGGNSVVASTITQFVEVRSEEGKYLRLLELLEKWYEKGSILVFVERQETVDKVFRELIRSGYKCLALHGGMDQADRDSNIADFKNGLVKLMIATSVAARGLDVKQLTLVVNFDVPNHYEDYIHRVGRTGRAGNKGTAITFITPDQDVFAPELVKAIEQWAKARAELEDPSLKKDSERLRKITNAAVPDDLRKLADGFSEKKKSGSVKFSAGSGYGGKGFKFTADENDTGMALRKLQAKEYGEETVVEEAKEESDDDGEVVVVRKVSASESMQGNKAGPAGSAGPTGPVGPAPAPAADQKPVNPDELLAEFLESAEQKAQKEGVQGPALIARLAQEKVKFLSSEVMRTATARYAQIGRVAPGQGVLGTTEKSAAAAAAAAITARLGGGVAPAVPVAPPVPEKRPPVAVPVEANSRFQCEIEINDYPQHARWKVTHKNSLTDVEEFTNTATVTKGNYFPPGRNPPEGERKLYLLIEGPDELSVRKARREIKSRLEAAALLRPDDKPAYGKYSVV